MSTVAVAGEERVPALDGLRAVAVLGVIASHSGLFGLGWVGVDIFFGLSGYLITGILLDAKAAAPTARDFFVPFYMRRALRIFPLAWIIILLVAAWRGQWNDIGWYFAYLVNWLPTSPQPSDLGHFWSLAVEEQFYTIWPAIVFLSSRAGVRRAAIGLIIFDVLFRATVSLWPPEFATVQWRDLATFARADTLAVGALLAVRQRDTGLGAARWALPVAVLSGIAMLAIRLLERGALWPLLTYNLKWPVLAVGVGAGLLFVLTQPPRWLQWSWLAWIGKVSYGVYVIHALFGQWLHEQFTLSQAPLIFLLQLGVTLPLAALSWYFFESPILKQKWRWPMPRARRPEPATARGEA